MRFAIDLDDDTSGEADKIRDVGADWHLPSK